MRILSRSDQNVRRKLELSCALRARGVGHSRRGVSYISRGTGNGGSGRNEFRAPSPHPGAIEAGAMLGSHRERNPSRSENWHRRTTRYTPALLRRQPPSRIPRNSAAAGDWRWRPRALRDKRHQHIAPPTAQLTLLPP